MQYFFKLSKDFSTMTIRELLEKEWLIPRKVRHFLRIRKNVAVNGKVKKFHEEVHAKDTIALTFEESDYPETTVLLGDSHRINVLFEDEHLIIVNKPYGIKTHPNQPNEDDTLLNHIAAYLVSKKQTPFVVHRLDKETSGAILFAKNPIVLPILGRMLERKEIYRTYQAVVKGEVKPESFTIDKKIGRDPHDLRKRKIDFQKGKRAITHVNVLRHNTQKSELEVRLDTGRTHQIRVHLSDYGHPLLGDPLYATKNKGNRLMLHAYRLNLKHPFTKEKISAFAEKNKLF